jgi:hypothetical protein
MTNLLEQAISTDDGSRAAKLIQNALGIESDEVACRSFDSGPNVSDIKSVAVMPGPPECQELLSAAGFGPIHLIPTTSSAAIPESTAM